MQTFLKTARRAYAYLLLMLLAPSALLSFGCPSDCSSCIVSRYANTDGITLDAPAQSGNLQGNPSPSQILVNNIPKYHLIKGLEVTLNISYIPANRLSVALLSPCGDCIILLNEVGGDEAEYIYEPTEGQKMPVTLVFSGCKGSPLTCNRTGVFNEQTVVTQPTDCVPGTYCFNGALDTTFCTTKLSKTFNKPAKGCWQLFTCIKPGAEVNDGLISSWKLKITHGLRAKDGCFDVFTSTCCSPCVC